MQCCCRCAAAPALGPGEQRAPSPGFCASARKKCVCLQKGALCAARRAHSLGPPALPALPPPRLCARRAAVAPGGGGGRAGDATADGAGQVPGAVGAAGRAAAGVVARRGGRRARGVITIRSITSRSHHDHSLIHSLIRCVPGPCFVAWLSGLAAAERQRRSAAGRPLVHIMCKSNTAMPGSRGLQLARADARGGTIRAQLTATCQNKYLKLQ